MIQQTPEADKFKQQLRDSLQRETLNSHAIKFARHTNVYACGDKMRTFTLLKAGRSSCSYSPPKAKNASWPSTRREIFSVSCAYPGLGARLETATAMEETVLKQIPLPSSLRA